MHFDTVPPQWSTLARVPGSLGQERGPGAGPESGFPDHEPLLPASLIVEAYERDRAVAASEYGTDGTIEFRSDLESFVGPDVVDACTSPGLTQRPPIPGVLYVAFVDPAGGGPASMVLAIAHFEGDYAVLDLVREIRPRFSPEAAVAEFADVLRWYGVTSVYGDRYGGEWPRERFAKCGILYEISQLTKSELYHGLLPLLNSRRVELLDDRRLRAQLLGLERHTGRSGRDSITHAPGQHDDVINAAAGALVLAREAATAAVVSFEITPEERRQLRAIGSQRLQTSTNSCGTRISASRWAGQTTRHGRSTTQPDPPAAARKNTGSPPTSNSEQQEDHGDDQHATHRDEPSERTAKHRAEDGRG